jgi:hypothetical protein
MLKINNTIELEFVQFDVARVRFGGALANHTPYASGRHFHLAEVPTIS